MENSRPTSWLMILLIAVCLAFTGCGIWPWDSGELNRTDAELAQKALADFFWHLSQGKYQEAADLYGGSYDILASYNPDLDPEDYPALWERACEINGFQCLQVEEILVVEEIPPSEFQLTASFRTSAGEVLQLDACCGEDPDGQPPQTQFTFWVHKSSAGDFLVLDLPVYMP